MSEQNQTITPRQALNEVIAACTRASYAWGQQEATVACLRVLEGLVIEAEAKRIGHAADKETSAKSA